MPNNITALNDDLQKHAEEEAAAYAENFNAEEAAELTPEEQERIAAMEQESSVVVTERNADGTKASIPLSDFAAPLDEKIGSIKAIAGDTEAMIKAVNQGDIRETVEDTKVQVRAQAIKAFKDLSVSDEDLDEDEILRINNLGLKAIQEHYGVERFTAEDIIHRMRKLSLRQIAEFVPSEFMSIYTRPSEVVADNIKAKERLLASIAYLVTTGPEMDYLNEYIDNQNRLMTVMQRLMKCQIDFTETLKDPQKMAEIAAKAEEISPQDTSVYAKYIGNDSKRVHNEFAQRAVISKHFEEAYSAFLDEYKDDPDAIREIQIQVDESHAKYEVYANVMNLELMRELWGTLTLRLKAENRNGYKNLEREAIAALDRCRRSKQNIPFPIYDSKLAKRPEELYRLYIEQYPVMIRQYNGAIRNIQDREPDATKDCDIVPVQIDGIDDEIVLHYFSMLLLILFGRIMKRLSTNNITKYDAIMLDAYFQCYCKMGSDIYLMNDVWVMMKDFVEYAIKTWPKAGGKGKR